jgi:hypothetical protein
MSDDLDLERRIASWIDDQFPAHEPDGLLRSVIDTTSQHRPRPAWRARMGGRQFSPTSSRAGFGPTPRRWSWWPAWRLPHVNTSFKIAVAAAAVIVLSVIGVNVAPRSSGVGATLPSPSPTPTAAPTPTPTPAPPLPSTGAIEPGTYRSDFMTFTVPAGWTSFQAWAALKNQGDPLHGLGISPWRGIAAVYTDPCHWQTTKMTVGPTVDDVVAALVAQQRGVTVTPVDVTVDGIPGKQLNLTVPSDVAIANCDGGEYKTWTDLSGGDRYNQGPGQHDVVDVLEVNGQILVVNSSYGPDATPADLAELQAVVDSVRITP